MPLILRVDVDKPYGNSNLFTKIVSKLTEDYYFPKINSLYLEHIADFIELCNSNNIRGYFYHRQCTIPNKKIIKMLMDGKHKYGLHAENTKSFETLTF